MFLTFLSVAHADISAISPAQGTVGMLKERNLPFGEGMLGMAVLGFPSMHMWKGKPIQLSGGETRTAFEEMGLLAK